MRILILPFNILKNKNCNKLFKRQIKQASKYFCFNDVHPDISEYLNKNHCSPVELTSLTDFESDEVLKQYIDIIGQISSVNFYSKTWWATDISSKNRLLSPMQETLNQFLFSIKAVDQCTKEGVDLYILGLSWHVSVGVRDYAKLKEVKVRITKQFISKVKNKISGIRKTWIYLVRSMLSSVLNLVRSNNAFNSHSKIDDNKPVFLIKSFIFSKSLTEKDHYKDQFFGNIQPFLEKELDKEDQIVTVVQGFVERYLCYKKLQDVSNEIIPVEYFLRLNDTLLAGASIFWYWVTGAIRIPNVVLFFGYNITSMLRELVSSNGKTILFGDYLYFYLARRLAKSYKLKACLMTYEGNHWERMFIMGLRSVYPELKIIGYQHSVIPQSAAGVFISKHELNIIPHPNQIITTGIKTANILKQYSYFPADSIKSGCALRYEYLYNMDALQRARDNPIVILVALEGVVEASSLLDYAMKQAVILSNVKFIVRAHPVIPLELLMKLIKMRREDMPKNMEESHSIEVLDDLKKSDVVLYWGSTISVEALMMGKPLICFNRGDALSYDPLYKFNSFKWSVDSNMNLADIIKEIQLMDKKEHNRRRNESIAYAKEYFIEPNQENMRLFIS